jgi:16S rRNA processing protein RimM
VEPGAVTSSRGWLRAGRVGRPHGLDGSFHVADPGLALPAVGGSVLVAGGQRRISRRAGSPRRPILRLEGCEDRAGAQALGGAELLVAREHVPDLGPDEWWAEDLEGCAVTDGAQRIGTVRRLLALPSCEVLEVARRAGQRELLVPLVSDAVRRVDVPRREIEIDLGFLGEP